MANLTKMTKNELLNMLEAEKKKTIKRTRTSKKLNEVDEAPGSPALKKQRLQQPKTVLIDETVKLQAPLYIRDKEGVETRIIPRPIPILPKLSATDTSVQQVKAITMSTLAELRANRLTLPNTLQTGAGLKYRRPGLIQDSRKSDFFANSWKDSENTGLADFTSRFDVEWKETTVTSMQIVLDDLLQDTDVNQVIKIEDVYSVPSEVAICYDISIDFN